MLETNYLLILAAVFVACISPGPGTIAIAATSAKHGRKHGSVLAFGIATGGTLWSCAAAYGLSSIMYANVWLFELLRYIGAAYLLYLAYKSVRSACSKQDIKIEISIQPSLKLTYAKGVAVQLSNPKVILFFASIYAVLLPAAIRPTELVILIVAISILANLVFQTYALMFSNPTVRSAYFRLRRYFESAFAVFFGYTGVKLLKAELE